jgi:hypothetical protein
MGDAALEAALERALTPYFLAFCTVPAMASFHATAGSGNVMGHLTLAPADWNVFVQDQALQEHFNSVFDTLAHHLDPARNSGGVDLLQ